MITSPTSNTPLDIADKTIVADDCDDFIALVILPELSTIPCTNVPLISVTVRICGSDVESNSLTVPCALDGDCITLAPTVNA